MSQLHIEGIPVFFDSDCPGIAYAEGFWPFRRYIRIGQKWMQLDRRAKIAVLLHEAYHIRAWHKWQRFVAMLFFPLPSFLVALAHRHEYAADKFAKSKGYGADLARALSRYPQGKRTQMHPPLTERLRRLDDHETSAQLVT
jgi:Peptidase family M48